MNAKNRSDQAALSTTQREELARATRAALWVGLILPLIVVTVALVLSLVWLPRMPNPAATHWSGTSGPDGFGPAATYPWLLVGVGYGIVAMLYAFIVFTRPSKRGSDPVPLWSGYQRFLAAFAFGYAPFMALSTLSSMYVQLDLQDAKLAGGIGGTVGIAFGVWAVLALIGWFLQPNVRIQRPSAGEVEALPLTDTQKAVWYGEVRPSKVFVVVVCFGLLALAGGVVIALTSPGPAWVGVLMAALFVVILVLALVTSSFRVRVDAQGLEARSVAGWPTFRLPASEVASVQASEINPMAEFGGWGLRWAPGRFGIVMRGGEGIIATRKDGRIFAVTVDDAATAASVLAAAAGVDRGKGK